MTFRLSYLLLLAGASIAVPALGVDIDLPPETATFKPSPLPGYALVQQHCMSCHSVHYVQTQPPTSLRSYWEAAVKKMKKPFGAQFPDDDIPAMVDYLTRVYGAERAGATPVAAAHPPAAKESATVQPPLPARPHRAGHAR
ncbi:SorB family sulfite dehydrogenase c-type cytochrome subunit [Massilia niastensis]|uniref:SorB family sulfite dehydrogenase c-type cytochrome subunit n=1 Tax=Massilia niastensis TaxID=544911 RepID=UPI00036AB293|nr:cytochrome c [Massilia niastensis]